MGKRGKKKDQPEQVNHAWESWCGAVLEQVRFWPDHKAIRRELLAHLEDGRADLERLGYAREVAEQVFAFPFASMGLTTAVSYRDAPDTVPVMVTLYDSGGMVLDTLSLEVGTYELTSAW